MTTAEKIGADERLIQGFSKNKAQLPGSKRIASLREQAILDFQKLGLPGRKSEEYKYSNVQPLFKEEASLVNTNLPAANGFSIEQFQLPGLKENTAVLVNGVFSPAHSSLNKLPKGVIVCSLKEAFSKNEKLVEQHYSKYAQSGTDAFLALSTSFAGDGVFVYVPDNTIAEQAIHIISVVTGSTPSLIFPRNLFIIGKNSGVQIVESFAAHALSAKSICIAVTEVFVDENAKAQYYKLQEDSGSASLISATHARQERNSHFDTNTVTLSGEWIRNNLEIALEGENCETHLNGLFLTEGKQHVDNHTLVDHRKPHCQSNQLYKGILGDKSTGVFNGKIFVRPDAQKTNAYQSSRNILLSDDASINTKPQLEIYADDVKCSHGSTTGQLNEDAMFYLRSRGLSTDSARNLLLSAFANDVLETVRIKELKDHLDELVRKRLEK